MGDYFHSLRRAPKDFSTFLAPTASTITRQNLKLLITAKKLRPKIFLRKVTIGSQIETNRHDFDYSDYLHTWEKFANEDKWKLAKKKSLLKQLSVTSLLLFTIYGTAFTVNWKEETNSNHS